MGHRGHAVTFYYGRSAGNQRLAPHRGTGRAAHGLAALGTKRERRVDARPLRGCVMRASCGLAPPGSSPSPSRARRARRVAPHTLSVRVAHCGCAPRAQGTSRYPVGTGSYPSRTRRPRRVGAATLRVRAASRRVWAATRRVGSATLSWRRVREGYGQLPATLSLECHEKIHRLEGEGTPLSNIS